MTELFNYKHLYEEILKENKELKEEYLELKRQQENCYL